MLAAKSLSKISPVDIYGNVAKRPLRGSKLDLFKQYRFALCFENSIFPGYYTEKPVHAWAGGCVPLYFSDRFADRDFNPAAIVNRIEFATLDEFRQHVARLDASQDAQAEIMSRPLLRERPSLDPAIGFLRETAAKITRAARPNVLLAGARPAVGRAGPPPKVARNAACSCGSGKKYKHCHGAST